MVNVKTTVKMLKHMKMLPKMNVNHAMIPVPHVNVHQMNVVLHVQETFTILTTMVIKLTDNVSVLAQ